MKPANWLLISVSFRWFPHIPTGSPLGNTTAPCIAAAMKSSGLFRRLKGFRRIFSRFDKLDVMFTAFIHFALIVEALR